MLENKKRLTLDLDAPLQRRLKAVAALKGVSMRQYCQSAIEKQLAQEEPNSAPKSRSRDEVFENLIAFRKRVFGDRVLPGNSVDIIREEREKRDEELWGAR